MTEETKGDGVFDPMILKGEAKALYEKYAAQLKAAKGSHEGEIIVIERALMQISNGNLDLLQIAEESIQKILEPENSGAEAHGDPTITKTHGEPPSVDLGSTVHAQQRYGTDTPFAGKEA